MSKPRFNANSLKITSTGSPTLQKMLSPEAAKHLSYSFSRKRLETALQPENRAAQGTLSEQEQRGKAAKRKLIQLYRTAGDVRENADKYARRALGEGGGSGGKQKLDLLRDERKTGNASLGSDGFEVLKTTVTNIRITPKKPAKPAKIKPKARLNRQLSRELSRKRFRLKSLKRGISLNIVKTTIAKRDKSLRTNGGFVRKLKITRYSKRLKNGKKYAGKRHILWRSLTTRFQRRKFQRRRTIEKFVNKKRKRDLTKIAAREAVQAGASGLFAQTGKNFNDMPESHDDGTGSMQTLRSAKEFYNNAQSKIDVTKVVYGDVKQTSIDAKNAAQKVNDFSQKLFKRTDLGLKTRVNRSLTKRKVRTVKTVNVKKSYQTRQYVAKTQKAAEKAKYAAAKAAETIRKIALAAKSAAAAPAVMVGALVIVLLCVVVASANALFSGNQTTVIAASYLAEDAELNKAETYFTQLEYNLQRTIDKIPNTYRYSQYGYGNINERYYNISAIDHNPSEVLAYLTSLRGEFKAANVKNDIKTLFDEMFQLDYREENIIVDSRWDSELGWIPIYHNILYVTLKARSADEVIHSGKKGTPPTPYKWLDGNDMIMYELRRDFRGNRFYFDSSTDFDWTYYAGGNFGYQYRYEDGSYIVNDNSKAKIRAGQKIKAPIAGIIVISGDIISVENKSSGLKIWFGGCSEFVSPEGAQVNKGDEIAVSGDNLSIQAQLNDLPLNPVIFVDTGEMTIQGGEPVNNKNFQVSAGALRDRDFARLIDKARPYIGKRYYFNACDPENSQFDNVGLICYVYNLQLWIPMGEGMSRRALPQDIYTWCGAVPENEIKPGDLAFFAATYPTPPIPDSDEKVATQIGIYVGDGHMLVCGDPIGFANVNTPYWQARLLGYGRVRPASS